MAKIFDKTHFLKYAKNTNWLILEKLLQIVSGVFVGLYVARYLGAERFGTLNYAQSAVVLFNTLTFLGITEVITRELITDFKLQQKILGTALILRLVGGGLFLLSMLVYIFFYEQNIETRWLIGIISFGYFFNSFDIVIYYFQAKVISDRKVKAFLISLSIGAILKLVFIFLELPLIYFAIALAAENIILVIALLVGYQLESKDLFKWRFDKIVAKRLILTALPLLISNGLMSIYMRIDQVMIEKILQDDAQNGYYAAAVRLSEMWYFVPLSICASVFPAILHAKASDEKRYQMRLQQLFDVLGWFAILVALFCFLFSDWIILLAYGKEYVPSAEILTIHIIGGFFISIGAVSGKWIYAEKLEKIVFFRTLLGAIVNIILNWYFLPIYGIKGAAWATVISYLLVYTISNLFHEKLIKLVLFQIRIFTFPFRINQFIQTYLEEKRKK
ncbi:flippase [Bernardetia sp. OM2101]|uniref:flippase n=1 Tax=Bernardetia sp. OM2101 TaxID=3344876 RepID=UPI0035CED79E